MHVYLLLNQAILSSRLIDRMREGDAECGWGNMDKGWGR